MDNEEAFRERLTRAEQDIKNQKENFQTFKADDFGALKAEVHSMRSEVNSKLEKLLTTVNGINLVLAKWMGGFAVALFIGELLAKKFL